MASFTCRLVGDCAFESASHTVTPTAPQLFALLLLLTLDRDKPLAREEAQRCLFGPAKKGQDNGHNLRQLVYRLRQLGFKVLQRPTGLSLDVGVTADALSDLHRITPSERAALHPVRFAVLPGYAALPISAFTDWLESHYATLEAAVRRVLLADVATFRAAEDWTSLRLVSCTLRQLDPHSQQAVIGIAEASFLLGERGAALECVDSFIRENALAQEDAVVLRQLRSRIARTTFANNQTSLRGRDDCLRHLVHQWTDAQQDGARLCVLVGSSGIGKTRVAEAFATRIALTGATVLRYQCEPSASAYPLSLFSHLVGELRSLRGALGASPRYRIVLDSLASAISEPPLPAEPLVIGAIRSIVRTSIIDLIEAVTSERPIALLIDDAHLLDEASCALLTSMTTVGNDARMLIVACSHTSVHNPRLSGGKRVTLYPLHPLSQVDSLAVLEDASRARPLTFEYCAWCLKQAGGNPFFLHALAYSESQRVDGPLSVVAGLAAQRYLALSTTTRLTLETCLLLGRLASISRVRAVSALEESALLDSLRALEDSDLVRLNNGILEGPHMLLHDALVLLIPASVRALLYARIAACLETECAEKGYLPPLAWVAAQNWLAAGDVQAAVRLARMSGAHATEIGEPGAAAALLELLPRHRLEAPERRAVLDDIARYAQSGGRRVLASSALRERLLLARNEQESEQTIKNFEISVIEADLMNGAPLLEAIAPLLAIQSDVRLSWECRAPAAVRLITIADCELDSSLAYRVYRSLPEGSQHSDVDRARLAYHTVFGSAEEAERLVRHLLAVYPTPDDGIKNEQARRFATYALSRLTRYDDAKRVARETFRYMSERRRLSEALYSASMLMDIAVVEGDFPEAEYWLGEANSCTRGTPAHELNPHAGYYSAAAAIAVRHGRYTEAQELHTLAPTGISFLSGRRYNAIFISLKVRLKQLSGTFEVSDPDVQRLREAYEIGRTLGYQDLIVEAIWAADVIAGRVLEASRFLHEYLHIHRRETGITEWSLRDTTGADPAWAGIPGFEAVSSRKVM